MESAPPSAKTVSSTELKKGMAPSSKLRKIARTQLYFFDACRLSHRRIRSVEKSTTAGIWDVDHLDAEDDRTIAAFHTAVPGRKAFGVRGGQSIFSLALLDCLQGGAAEVRCHNPDGTEDWGVSASSLQRHLAYHLARLNAQHGATQAFAVDELRGDVWLHRLEQAPPVDVELALVPAGAEQRTAVSLLDAVGKKVWNLPAPVSPHPYTGKVPAGGYSAVARVSGAEGRMVDLPPQPYRAEPPHRLWFVRT